MNSTLPEIRGDAFTKAREKLGLSTKELSGMACLSNRQIEQIENGETSSYYSAQIKVTAAKKVAKLLKLSEEDAFDYGVQVSEKLDTTPVELPIGESRPVTSSESEKVKPVSAKKENTKPEAVKAKELLEETPIPAVASTEEKKAPVVKVQAAEIPFNGSARKSQTSSQKKLFLGLSVVAAAVFAVINLQPLFFPEKPVEIALVKEEIIEPVPAAVPAEPAPAAPITPSVLAPAVLAPAAVTTAEVSTACPAEEGIMSYRTEAPRKAADMVYVQVKLKQVVCVSDASGKVQNKMIEPGTGASFYGKPPFKVLTGGIAQADIFFQGAKVRLTNPSVKTVVLEASELASTPAVERTDSQLR
jgi:transcriptional regulator with XRE-family HTH domain